MEDKKKDSGWIEKLRLGKLKKDQILILLLAGILLLVIAIPTENRKGKPAGGRNRGRRENGREYFARDYARYMEEHLVRCCHRWQGSGT